MMEGDVKCDRRNQLQQMIQEAEWAGLGADWMDVGKGEEETDGILNTSLALPGARVRNAGSWAPATEILIWEV